MDIVFTPFSDMRSDSGAFSMAGYAHEYHDFVKKRYRMSSGFLEIRERGTLVCVVPACFNDASLYAFYKHYTEPAIADIGPMSNIRWDAVADLARKKLKLKSAEFHFSGMHQASYEGMKPTGFSTYVFRMRGITDGDSIRSRLDRKSSCRERV